MPPDCRCRGVMSHTFTRLCLLLVLSQRTICAEHPIVNCSDAIRTCNKRSQNCALLYHTFNLGCQLELREKLPGGFCSDTCRESLISLSSITEGYDIIRCDCNDDADCLREQEILRNCWPRPVNFTATDFVNDDKRERPCDEVRDDCKYNRLCWSAYILYGKACRKAIEYSKIPCSEECVASARVFYAVNKDYFTCECNPNKMMCERENRLISTKCFDVPSSAGSASVALTTLALSLFLLCL